MPPWHTPTAKFLLEYVRSSYLNCRAFFLRRFHVFADFGRLRQIIFVANALVRGVICRAAVELSQDWLALIACLKF